MLLLNSVPVTPPKVTDEAGGLRGESDLLQVPGAVAKGLSSPVSNRRMKRPVRALGRSSERVRFPIRAFRALCRNNNMDFCNKK